jgi:cathepsin C
VGEWRFNLGSLQEKRSSCGHERPDAEEDQPQTEPFPNSVKNITLLEPHIAKSATDKAGTFTMIYDEGFEVRVDGLVLFAFSHFDFVKGPDGKSRNVSHCGKTHRGWYRDAARTKWGCYSATKVDQQDVSLLQVPLLQVPPAAASLKTSPEYDKVLPRSWQEKRVSRLNLLQMSWTARVYDKFVGKSMRQLNTYAGIQRNMRHGIPPHRAARQQQAFLEVESSRCPQMPVPKRTKDGEVLPRLATRGQGGMKPCQLRQQISMYAQSKSGDEALNKLEQSLPRNFDWRNALGGRNFLEPVMDQADCGSCYMVATMRMLSARYKISINNSHAEPWSINFPLHCSEYNQGCKGGYAFLASKWSDDVGLLPASCAPYDVDGTCTVKCDPKKLSKRYRASNHRYVGGWYGNSSSAEMMLEIYNNGPLVASFEPTDDFMLYSGGVFSQARGIPAPLAASKTEWLQVDHAILLVGWGEQLGEKYWIAQNSWGLDWGEAGFFRIARDSNDSGMESIVVAADVVEDSQPEVLTDFLQQMIKPVVIRREADVLGKGRQGKGHAHSHH